MNNCPYANESATCDLPPVEGDQDGKQAPTIAYCKQCSQVVFRCTSGHWNRTFARYCTQCSQKLEKPAQWDMASGNPQRTATFSTDSVDVSLGLNSGVVNTPPIETSENLPGILIIDGLFILPNPNENRFEACTIVNTENSIRLHHQWGIDFNTPSTYGSTPIYHGLHLYSVVSRGIQKTNVISGKTELINNISGMDAAQIEPLPGCAPLKCEVNGKPTMIAGVKQGVLLFDFANDTSEYIQHAFFDEATEPMSPTLCGNYVVFTSLAGHILSIDIEDNLFKPQFKSYKNISFSAGVSIGESVYFEAINQERNRLLVSYAPESKKIENRGDFDTDNDLDRHRSRFIHPPLTDGEKLFLADTFGETVHTYNSHHNSFTRNTLSIKGNLQHVFIPQRSVVVGEKIYSVHQTGLSILNLGYHFFVSYSPLTVMPNDNPMPVAPPIWYGEKLFVLCEDRLICIKH